MVRTLVEFQIKVNNKQGTAYFAKEIREAFGNDLKLLPASEAGAIYRKDADLVNVIRSLQVIIDDLKHRVKEAELRGEKQ